MSPPDRDGDILFLPRFLSVCLFVRPLRNRVRSVILNRSRYFHETS